MSRAGDYRLGRKCQCGKAIFNRSKTGLCQPCFLAKLVTDPNRAAKIAATLRARLKDPDNYAKHLARCKRAGKTKRANPEYVANAARFMREVVQPLSMTPESMAKRNAADNSWKCAEAKIAWCPPHFRDDYRLFRSKRLSAPEARQIVESMMRDAEARLSPFERQDRALARGAALVANDHGPSLDRPVIYAADYDARRAG